MRVPHPASASKGELSVLKVKRALKGVQFQPSAPELDERQARLREYQSPSLVYWRNMLEAEVTLVSSRDLAAETGIGFFWALEQPEGK